MFGARRGDRSPLPARGPAGCRGCSRAGWRCRRAGSRCATESPASASMHRCTMPSPPHTKTRSAPASSAAAHLLRRALALGHLEPQRVGDAVPRQHARAARGIHRRTTCRGARRRPPSSSRTFGDERLCADLRRLGTFHVVRGGTPSCGLLTGTDGEQPDGDASQAHEGTYGDVARVVHASVHTRDCDSDRAPQLRA